MYKILEKTEYLQSFNKSNIHKHVMLKRRAIIIIIIIPRTTTTTTTKETNKLS